MSRQEKRVGRHGEFRGDFTRDTFNADNQYSRVFLQQGRVSIDADWNEFQAINAHYQRMFATAVIGPHAAPWSCPNDFKLRLLDTNEYELHRGHYFVNGLLCVNDRKNIKGDLADLLDCESHDLKLGTYVFYLDVWESHITYIDDGRIREQALGGADTATRAKINWKVCCKQIKEPINISSFLLFDGEGIPTGLKQNGFLKLIREDMKPGNGRMWARGKPARKDSDLCSSDSGVGYRGKENQLYRVEICCSDDEAITFKWSRENSSVIFPVRDIANDQITLEHLGRDICTCLKVNDWVEVISADQNCYREECVLYQVVNIDEENYTVTLDHNVVGDFDDAYLAAAHLRRWDHSGGDEKGISLAEAVGEWYELEDGIEIRFLRSLSDRPADNASEKDRLEERAGRDAMEDSDSDVIKPVREGREFTYQPGDYWLIPARSASNSIEWPTKGGKPKPLPAHGVVHHYAPLRLLHTEGDDASFDIDTRRVISQNWQSVPQGNSTPGLPSRGRSNTDSSPGGTTDTAATRKKRATKKTKKKAGKKR